MSMTDPTQNTPPDTAQRLSVIPYEGGIIAEDDNGDLVSFADYTALQAALDAATARADKAEAERGDWDRTYRAAAALVLAERARAEAALSRVTEADTKIANLHKVCKGYEATIRKQMDALAQPSGADPAQDADEMALAARKVAWLHGMSSGAKDLSWSQHMKSALNDLSAALSASPTTEENE